ncbi:MAG: hypothetical protein DI534_08000 [Leifsonia xyli]|nr:MAG: hypothetical protein DI534_08000 [Leifsonia xyli]
MTTTAQALALMREVATTQSVELVDGPAGDWQLRDGQFVNTRADFFRIIGARIDGREELLIRQQETALVGLLVSRGRGGLRLLLSARAEPGLHGGCQLSATVQSTPSNYERRHGGAATPRLDDILAPVDEARVLHDSLQYDWAQYYDRKTKRFRIVETDAAEPTPPAMAWVPEQTVRELARHDFTLTSDLRAALALLPGASASTSGATTSIGEGSRIDERDSIDEVPIERMHDWMLAPSGIVTTLRDRDLVWATTRSSTREIMEWSQPLMRVNEPLRVELAHRAVGRRVEVALREETRVGLGGHTLWFPAPAAGTHEMSARVRVSAEGGRFWRHEVDIHLARTDRAAAGARWFSLEEAEEVCRAGLRSSVELRIAMQLLRDAPDGQASR